MRIKSILFLLLFPLTSFAEEMSFVDFLNAAWEKSPVVKGEALQRQANDQLVSSVRGKYLPQVSLDAIDTTGFPASNSGLQTDGLMASPFRSGLAGGLVVQQTVYDFGRIQSVLERAKATRSLNEARLAQEKLQYLGLVARLYLTCARTRSLQRNDEELMSWAKLNLDETARFTKTGQRSIVDNSLVQTEVNGLKLELDQLRKYQASLTDQMKLYGGTKDCKALSDSWQFTVPESLQVDDPSLLLAKAQIEIAHASYQEAKTNQLPTIKVMGSVGEMETVRLVDNRDNYYALGVGISFPIWNGGEDAKRAEAYKSQTDYQTENLKAAQLEYASQLKDLRDQYDREREALKVVEKDMEQVQKTIRLASKRYHSLQGPLIDVREAFKQLRDLSQERIQFMNRLGSTSLQLGILRAGETLK